MSMFYRRSGGRIKGLGKGIQDWHGAAEHSEFDGGFPEFAEVGRASG